MNEPLPRLADLPPRSEASKGIALAQFCQMLALTKGDLMMAAEVAHGRWRDSLPTLCLKSAAAAGTTTATTWALPLRAQYQTMVSEFLEYLRPLSIIGRMAGLRRVPLGVRAVVQSQGATVGWVGQGVPAKASELAYTESTLGLAKISGVVVISQELARSTSGDAVQMIRQELADAISQYQDAAFVDLNAIAVANVSPAAITSGLTAVQSTGATAATILADAKAAIAKLTTAGIALRSPYWIMRPSTAAYIGTLTDTAGSLIHQNIGPMGGTWLNIPVITSASVPSMGTGGTIIALVDANEIWYADGGVELDASSEAALQMDDAPSSSASQMRSLFAENNVGIKALRYTNWSVRRSGAVAIIDNVGY